MEQGYEYFQQSADARGMLGFTGLKTCGVAIRLLGYAIMGTHLTSYLSFNDLDLKRLMKRLLDTNPVTRVTVDEIVNDPWFKIGYKPIEFHNDYLELKELKHDDADDDLKVMNAFDILTFSSSYNLSGLFEECEEGERFLSSDSSEKIIRMVVAMAVVETEEQMVVVKKEWCVKVVGGSNCNFET
ncbi:hypothetical protein QVD17_06581 [Tagetes erecta]|uniref:non-specific serine/threonine protein kinase n=1 Tax=Tagetes erecta TaxID=13708 RepID=A0AAD8LDX5_TARER|nr:hypothetical protein QVD17_06581 [Tagetes erecta]